MASQSPNSPPQDSQLSNQEVGAGGSEPADQLVFEPPQPMREDYIQNAVNFLSHPRVKGSPVIHRRSFLEKKGLMKEEIDEAFRRIPDPQPSTAGASAAGSQQVNNPNQPTAVQPHTSTQSVQPAPGLVASGPIVLRTQRKFSWFHALLAAGLFVGFGASGAFFLKKLFLPRLKSWICKVVAEGNETEDEELKFKLCEETAEDVKASASAVSAVTKTNQKIACFKGRREEDTYEFNSALNSQAKKLKSLSDSVNHIREDRLSQYRLLEEHIPSAPRNGPVNSSWRASQQTSMYGAPSSDFGSGRHSYVPMPKEPTSGSFSKSYAEIRNWWYYPWEMPQYPSRGLVLDPSPS